MPSRYVGPPHTQDRRLRTEHSRIGLIQAVIHEKVSMGVCVYVLAGFEQNWLFVS